MRFLKFFLGKSRRTPGIVAAAVLFGALSGAVSVALLALVNATLQGDVASGLGRAALLFAGLCAVVTGTRVASQYILARLGQGMAMELRVDLSRQILATPLRRLEELGPDRLLATLTEDVNTIVQSLVFIPILCVNGTVVVGCLAYLAWMDVRLFLWLLVVMAVGVTTYQIAARTGIRLFREARDAQDELFQHFRGLLYGIKELKLHRRRRDAFLRLIERTTDGVRRLRLWANLVFGVAGAWGHLLFFAVIGVLLYTQGAFFAVTPETLTSYTVVLLYMMTPLQDLLNGFPNLSRSEVAVSKIERLGFLLQPSFVSASAPMEVEAPSWLRIELRSVTHVYHREAEDRDFVLGPIDWTLEPGEIVFLVGGNGSGKTTLAKVIAGLYEPEEGAILVDGRKVDSSSREDYRQLFTAVFSDFFLFEELLGLEGPNLDRTIREYLTALRLDRKIEVEGGTFSTLDLSQGQRKRLALLTAFLERRDIYLFDEWAADQDPVFKEVFYRQILPAIKERGKSAVVISHDDRYFEVADRVVWLEEGRLRTGPTQSKGRRTRPGPVRAGRDQEPPLLST